MEKRFLALWDATVHKPCDGLTDLFFFHAADKATEAYARQFCTACPLMRLCGEYAVEQGIREGMWGGTTPEERGYLAGGKLAKHNRLKREQAAKAA